MNFRLSFIENEINVDYEYVRCIEIENKKVFYHFVDVLNKLSNGDYVDDFYFLNDKVDFAVFIDYFNIDYNSKKITNCIHKIVKEKLDDFSYDVILKNYKRIQNEFCKILNEIDISLSISEEMNLEGLIKLLNVNILYSDDLLKNLLLMIDIFKVVEKSSILVFVNLKEYLTKEELKELYKYALYNHILIILVDNKAYGVCQEYEKKLIVDDDLEEFML